MLLSAAAVRPAAPQRLTLALTRYQTHVTDSPPAQRRTYRDSRNNMRSKPRCLSSAARSQLKRKDAFFSQKIAMRGVRYASTSAASSQTSPPSSIPSDPRQSSLTWQQFFDLRRSRRRYNVSSSVISAGGSTYLGMVLLQSNALDILSTMFGLDPFVSMGLTVTAAGGAGWLLGPVAGSTVFRLANSKVMRDMEAVSHGNLCFWWRGAPEHVTNKHRL